MKRKGRDFGALLVDKPRGPSSHEIVQWVRWALGTSSVGHCGTLDPDASGLLVVVVGKATRLASRLTVQDKSYDAVFALGARTQTDDSQGAVIERARVEDDQLHEAARIINGGWEGVHQLPPPSFSAVRVNGVRAHEAARRGESLELEAREMRILRSRTLSPRELESMPLRDREDLVSECRWIGARLDVSKGSYIRSLALELGRRVEAPAHLAALRRGRCADLELEDPRVLRELSAIPWTPAPNGAPRWRIRWGEGDKAEQGAKLRARLVDPFELLGLPRLCASAHPEMGQVWAPRFLQGQGMPAAVLDSVLPEGSDQCVWVDENNREAAILRRDPDPTAERWAPELVLRWPAPCDSSKKSAADATKA